MKKFDLIVIGAGSGLSLAAEAAQAGKKVAIVESGPMGGTCLNRGCIPSKIVIHSAEIAELINKAKTFGINAKISKINFKQVTDRANNIVDKDARMIKKNVKAAKNPMLYPVKGKFIGNKKIQVGKEIITAPKIVIAAGARPTIPKIEGLDKVPYWTSTEALRATKQPKTLMVIGGGYIGCELGNFYAALGTKVKVILRHDKLLSREDGEVSQLYTKLWEQKYGPLIKNANILKVEKKGKEFSVIIEQKGKKKVIKAEALLVATGVRPNSDILDVTKTGVKVNKRGFVQTNKFMETNVKGIWALGDIAGKYMFKHSANLEAGYVQHNMYNKKVAVDYYPMPHAVFTIPEIAGVGMTEEQVIEKGKKYMIGKYYYKNTGKGEALAEKDGFVKMIIDSKNNEILGCHIIGPDASVLLHEVLIAMKAGKTKALDLLQRTIYIHPALNEVVQRATFNIE